MAAAHEEKRQAVRSTVLGAGTLACRRCDAPVALAAPARLTDPLTCPFCTNAGPVRDFLSLGLPTRPNRVLIRVGLQAAATCATPIPARSR